MLGRVVWGGAGMAALTRQGQRGQEVLQEGPRGIRGLGRGLSSRHRSSSASSPAHRAVVSRPTSASRVSRLQHRFLV